MIDLQPRDNRILRPGAKRAEVLGEPLLLSGVLVVVVALTKKSRIIYTETDDNPTRTLRDRSRKKTAPHDRS